MAHDDREIQKCSKKTSPIAYIMSRFPASTETFILREMLELEKLGQPLLILPLIKVTQPTIHSEVKQLKSEIHFTPFISLKILYFNFLCFKLMPIKYFRLLWYVLKNNLGSANLFVGAVGIFPKSVYFAHLLKVRGIKHVHAHFATHPALSALIVSELTNITFSFTAHAHDIFVRKKMIEEKIKKANFIVTISKFNKNFLLRHFKNTPEDKIYVIHCGVELELYQSEEKPAENTEAFQRSIMGKYLQKKQDVTIDDTFLILCVASFKPYKGLQYLVKACSLLRNSLINYSCLIVGEGKERKNIERLINALNLQESIHLVGNQSQDAIAKLLSISEVFVLPSVIADDGQMEGIPVAIMEAMASEVPVVSTNISGIPELVEDGVTGTLVPPGDEQALAEAILKLYNDKTLRTNMGRLGRDKVAAEFELKSNVAKLNCLFSDAINQTTKNANFEEDIETLIKLSLKQRCPEHADCGDIQNISLLPAGAGHDSKVYKVALKKDSNKIPQLILKVHVSHNNQTDNRTEFDIDRSQREYNSLLLLWTQFNEQSSYFRVPKPYDHFPEFAAILMEQCQGQRFDHSLRLIRFLATKSDIADISNKAKACGEWLALFHSLTEKEDDLSGIYERIEREFDNDLRKCTDIGLDGKLVNRLASLFEDKKDLVFNGSHRIVAHHCDFGPYNVFISTDKVTVIDFEGIMDGVIYDDICYFLCMIDTIPSYHLNRKMRVKIKENFVEGYSKYGAVDQDEVCFFMVINMVKIMSRNPVFRKGAHTWLSRLKSYQKFKIFQSRLEEQLFDKRLV